MRVSISDILVIVLFVFGLFFVAQGAIMSRCEVQETSETVQVETKTESAESNWARPLGLAKFELAGISVDEEFNYESELLMLARAIYSESKRTSEQYIIAWIIRNRVETGYRGERSYRAVVLDPVQFSAFNDTRLRDEYLALNFETDNSAWQNTLGVARSVIRVPYERNPLPSTARHFYAPRSMRGKKAPSWAKGKKPIELPGVNSSRLVALDGVN